MLSDCRRKPFVRLSGLGNRINTAHTRDLIRRLNQEAITVLRNKNNVLPLDADTREVAVLNVGDAKRGTAVPERTLRIYKFRRDERKSHRLSAEERLAACCTQAVA